MTIVKPLYLPLFKKRIWLLNNDVTPNIVKRQDNTSVQAPPKIQTQQSLEVSLRRTSRQRKKTII